MTSTTNPPTSTTPEEAPIMTETMNRTETVARPLVDFSGKSRATAREYAEIANSRVLQPASQEVLTAASQGQAVDAYALNAAVTDAMRSCATRHGQSMGRRDMARKVAYLGHICQAVLANHADGLPVYADSGVRSRKIEELSLEIEHAGVVNQSLAADLTKERDLRRMAQNHYLGVSQQVENQDRRITALIREKTEAEALADNLINVGQTLEAQRDEVADVLAYALEHMDPSTRARVLGYWDGIAGI